MISTCPSPKENYRRQAASRLADRLVNREMTSRVDGADLFVELALELVPIKREVRSSRNYDVVRYALLGAAPGVPVDKEKI
jgi:hypothetical protein